MKVGRMLPCQLRRTAQGGLALSPHRYQDRRERLHPKLEEIEKIGLLALSGFGEGSLLVLPKEEMDGKTSIAGDERRGGRGSTSLFFATAAGDTRWKGPPSACKSSRMREAAPRGTGDRKRPAALRETGGSPPRHRLDSGVPNPGGGLFCGEYQRGRTPSLRHLQPHHQIFRLLDWAKGGGLTTLPPATTPVSARKSRYFLRKAACEKKGPGYASSMWPARNSWPTCCSPAGYSKGKCGLWRPSTSSRWPKSRIARMSALSPMGNTANFWLPTPGRRPPSRLCGPGGKPFRGAPGPLEYQSIGQRKGWGHLWQTHVCGEDRPGDQEDHTLGTTMPCSGGNWGGIPNWMAIPG